MALAQPADYPAQNQALPASSSLDDSDGEGSTARQTIPAPKREEEQPPEKEQDKNEDGQQYIHSTTHPSQMMIMAAAPAMPRLASSETLPLPPVPSHCPHLPNQSAPLVKGVVDTAFIDPLPEERGEPGIGADKDEVIEGIDPPPRQQKGVQAARRLLCFSDTERALRPAVTEPGKRHAGQGNNGGHPLQQQFSCVRQSAGSAFMAERSRADRGPRYSGRLRSPPPMPEQGQRDQRPLHNTRQRSSACVLLLAAGGRPAKNNQHHAQTCR